MRQYRPDKAKKVDRAQKEKFLTWRNQPVINPIEGPSNVRRARSLGYRAKQGYIVVRIAIGKGGRHRERPNRGRVPSHYGKIHYTPKKSHQVIAEERVSRKYPNMEVLNSYWAGEDGVQTWYEVILVDPNHPSVLNDPRINWLIRSVRRAYRGLTSAAKKSRGLRNKGKGAEHIRPSVSSSSHK